MRMLSRTLGMAAVVAVASVFSAGIAQGQAAATMCKDGTTSAASGRGACSGHGGVKAAATKAAASSWKKGAKAAAKAEPKAAPMSAMAAPAPAKAVPAKHAAAVKPATHATAVAGSGAKEDNNPAGAIAKCKDGLYSHATHRQGACSGHGGVASWS